MKKGSRVKLSNCERNNANDLFWSDRDIDYNSVGTITEVSNLFVENQYVFVMWDNGTWIGCGVECLQIHDEDISLPNKMFIEHKKGKI